MLPQENARVGNEQHSICADLIKVVTQGTERRGLPQPQFINLLIVLPTDHWPAFCLELMMMYVSFHFHIQASDRDGRQRRMDLSRSSPFLSVLQEILLSRHSASLGVGRGRL